MVNKERVRLLVEALRSGEFEQGEGYLRKGDTYCCLGVACKVAMQNGLPLQEEFVDHGFGLYVYREAGQVNRSGYLPGSVYRWYGFDDMDPEIVIQGVGGVLSRNTATNFNDRGFTFNEIADGFERTYLKEEEDREEHATQ